MILEGERVSNKGSALDRIGLRSFKVGHCQKGGTHIAEYLTCSDKLIVACLTVSMFINHHQYRPQHFLIIIIATDVSKSANSR